MKCRAVRRLMVSYLDGDLDEAQEHRFTDHLGRCESCRQALADALATRDLLRRAVSEEYEVPSDLSGRIRAAAQRAQEEAQLRAAPSGPAFGSPAFVATCASLVVGAIMSCVITTQVYMKNLDAEMARNEALPIILPSAPGQTKVAVATPAAATKPTAVSPPARTARGRESLATAPKWASAVTSRSERQRQWRLAATRDARATSAVRGRLVARPAGGDANVRRAAAAVQMAAAGVSGASQETTTRQRHTGPVRMASISIGQGSASGPADRARLGSGRASQSSQEAATRGLVAGMVARYAVERYVAERIIESEPTLLAVAGYKPTGGTTSGSETSTHQ